MHLKVTGVLVPGNLFQLDRPITDDGRGHRISVSLHVVPEQLVSDNRW